MIVFAYLKFLAQRAKHIMIMMGAITVISAVKSTVTSVTALVSNKVGVQWRSLMLLGFLLSFSGGAFALVGERFIAFEPANNYTLLLDKKNTIQIVVDQSDYKGVIRTANDFAADIQRVTGQQPSVEFTLSEKTKNIVLLGTLGKSALVDQLVDKRLIDVSSLTGQWDGYLIVNIANPFEGIDNALVVVGANKRGTSYGAYQISEQIGVSPWYYWADVPVEKRKALYVKQDTHIQEVPKVKYRGIFLNDEAPALTGWVTEKHGGYNHKFYVNVFELMLRLRANYLWPAMWNNAFGDDDPQNLELADEYGIVMGTSHHEPMMRADKEWNRYGQGVWDYARNPKNLYKFWTDGAKRNKPFESLYTIGMRGQEDKPMSESENIGLLETIVEDQRKIFADVFGQENVSKIPQVWCLYKEVQTYYEKGMRVPDDVILLWSDDNWGNLRRLPTPQERERSGGAGIYYHFDYVGGPRSYRWINTVPIAKIWQQMSLAYEYGADKIWITNVGDLKPMEVPIEFFLEMAWDPQAWTKERMTAFTQDWATREFGAENAVDIAQLITAYTLHNGRVKPELVEPDTFSLLNFGEAERIESQMKALVEQADTLYKKIPKSQKDAFFQLVLYPVKASAAVTLMNIAIGKNRLYANQGRSYANDYADLAESYFKLDADLEEQYHKLKGGKWNHFMSQPHIGYSNWNNPEGDQMPAVYRYTPGNYGGMGIYVEGFSAGWPSKVSSTWPHKGNYEFNFEYFGQQSREIIIYNRGTKPFDFKATASSPWITLSQTQNTVKKDQTITVSIDWASLPEGESIGNIHIDGTGYGGANVAIQAFKPSANEIQNAKGFVEGDGYIAFDAVNYMKTASKNGIEWQEIKNLGRTHSTMAMFPAFNTAIADISDAPFLEYPVTFLRPGKISVNVYMNPSLSFQPGAHLRYAVAIGNAKPIVIQATQEVSKMGKAWDDMVINAINIGVSEHTIKASGATTLRIYGLDSGLRIQKIVVDTGKLKPSYLGPEQSLLK